MKKSYIVDSTCNDMRLDRWLRLKIGKIPQGLVEKYLRTGKIKHNKKKAKSSVKVKTNDEINIFNVEFKETIQQKKIKKIDPNGNSIFETMEEAVSYRFDDRIQSKKMGPFLNVLDEVNVKFEEARNGNLTLRKYTGLSVFSDLSLPVGKRIIYPNVTVQFAGVGTISENTLFRGIKVELGEPVNEPLSDNQEEKAFPF